MSCLCACMEEIDFEITQILSPSRFIDHDDIYAYEASVRNRLEYQPSSLSSHELSVGRHMVAYSSYMEEQRLLTTKNLDVKSLSRALSRFTSLEEMNIDLMAKRIGLRELTEAFGAFKYDDLLTRDCEYTLPVVFRALSQSTAELKTFSLGHGADMIGDQIGNPTLGDDVSAGDDSNSLRQFSPGRHQGMITEPHSLETMPCISTRVMYATFGWQHEDQCRYILRGLQRLAIRVSSIPTADPLSLSEMATALQHLIIFAPLLRTIFLKQFLGDLPRCPTMIDIFGYHHLRHLQNLDLWGYNAKEQDLIDFLTTHSATIINVRFRAMYITDSRWAQILPRLRNITFPVLQTFVLDDCGENIKLLQAQDYILRRSENNPIFKEAERLSDLLTDEEDEIQSAT